MVRDARRRGHGSEDAKRARSDPPGQSMRADPRNPSAPSRSFVWDALDMPNIVYTAHARIETWRSIAAADEWPGFHGYCCARSCA
jgi:hypothetical protein